MATFTKLSENEMNYYQFKAKQILLQKKEEKEWQEFCKQNAPDCVACSVEKAVVKELKDVGMQTFPKILIPRTDRISLQSNYKKDQLPEAFVNVKNQLEKIDFCLSKLVDEFHGRGKDIQKYEHQIKSLIQERRPVTFPTFTRQQAVNPSKAFLLSEQRKLQIQNNLKRDLQNSTFIVHKKPPEIRPRNTGFFLPHDLQVKRAASRKAYLASLQTKPKVSFQSKKVSSIKNVKNSQSKKSTPTREKTLLKKENMRPNEDNEETFIKAFAADDTKDENIESVVDSVFEALLGETALDLSRIRQKKRENYYNAHSEALDKAKKSSLPNPPTSFPVKCNRSKIATNADNSIMKLKFFIDSFQTTEKENNLRKKQSEYVDKSTSTPKIEDSRAVCTKKTISTSRFQEKQDFLQTIPKFICGVTNIIKVDSERAKDISSKRDRFWKYLENNSQIPKGKFNPWILNDSLAESILEDCISDIAEELNEMPSSIICDLYNKEFLRQVEV